MKKEKNKQLAKEIMIKALKTFIENKDKKELMKSTQEAVKNIKVANFAKTYNIAQTSVYRLFSEKGNPSFDYMCRFLNYLGIEIKANAKEKYENEI